MHERQRVGRQGEEIAARHLVAAGYVILARNWRCPAGEVDIVAQQGDTLVVVEVKTRRSRRFGLPEEAITPAKAAVLLACGQYLAAEREWAGPWRVDVLAVELPPAGGAPAVRLLPGAVEA